MDSKAQILLESLEKRANKLLHNNYKKYFNKKYDIQIIENVMCNETCHFVALFKDYLIADDNSEYLRRIYKKNESVQRLIKLFAYYQETSVIFPNYTPLVESKYLYNNVIRKQRVIDEQQNLEEYKKYLVNKEKKKNKKTSPLKAIENIFEQDTEEEEVSRVFNSKAYDEILNTTESVKRIVFGIENDKNKNKEQTPGNDSVKELLMKLDNLEGIKEKNKDLNFINDVKKKLKYAAKLLVKNENVSKNNIKSLSKDKNNISKKVDKKEHNSPFKKNRTININININNTKNNIAMTDRPFISNNNLHHIANKNFPITTKDILKEKKFIFNQKRITLPYQLFRNSNLISNLNKNKNNNINNNSINGLQQKLIEIFSKKLKKNKNNRNNSHNLSLSRTTNTNRLITKNKAFIISTIQNTILHPKSKRNRSINIKSDKHIYIKNKRNNSTSKNNKNIEKYNAMGHKRVNSHIITINNNIDIEKNSNVKKNLKEFYNNSNRPVLTISPSLKKRNVFGFKTMSKLTESIPDYNSKKIFNKNTEFHFNYSQNNSLKNKNYNNKRISATNVNIFSYKTNNNKVKK